jgi:arginine decarboxylase
MNSWTPQQARDTYNTAHWGGGYFDVNDRGNLIARPNRDPKHPGVDLFELAEEIRNTGLSAPVLVRFTDILHDRVDTLCGAFADAMREDDYRGRYTAVYPIKVNQQKRVVEEILQHGGDRVGLEAGSKPELMAVLALSNTGGGIIVCNGYKDREYIRLALIGRQLGHRVYIVVEKTSELEAVIAEARELQIQPLIGVRVRLASIGAGKWQNTGGEKSKFGLSSTQVLRVIDRLRDAGMLDSLQLIHFHLGSQLPNIHDIQRGMRECARFYAEMHRLGVGINCVDVGGGLGVDYEGTRSRSYCSMNYSVHEYAKNVVRALWEICSERDLPHPDIITESGRAMTAHHAMLITNVIDIERVDEIAATTEPSADAPLIVRDLWDGYQTLLASGASRATPVEAYHDAAHRLSEVQAMYTHGVLTLEQRAHAEQLYFATCWKVREMLQPGVKAHRELLDELNEKLADKYFLNLSIFQSLPDVWAIEQVFPVIPLHRLNESPTRRGTLQDITCDSDGRIDHYVDGEGIESSLPLHTWSAAQPYLLGIFMVGAYQEILGDMHNLFGDTDSVNVELAADGTHRLTQPQRGDTVDSVLRYVQFNPPDLLRAYREKINRAALTPKQRESYLQELNAGLSGYTYLEE